MRARKLLFGFLAVIIGTILAGLGFARWLGLALVVVGALYTWFQVAHVMMTKPWSAFKMKAMHALAGFMAVAVCLTPFRLAPRGILMIALVGFVIGWFVPLFLTRKKDE
jgi:hypothetical protein